MAKKKKDIVEELPLEENISVEPLESVMSDRYATYAKYVIQDRAIPDVRDGLKPVQRRILFSMWNTGNIITKPTRKCAHTVGEVMGKYHPHGDTSIYEALARMSQDWKVRSPLIDFQGNNGSIDGDSPAAYRYTEARLSELSNEMLRDIDKDTVDMALTFDDTDFEPVVLPSRFPNLLVNGSDGIAVALATEIPTHNLKEVIDACIYRINHKTASIEDLMQFVPGPDFPTGGIIYNSPGLEAIYKTGRGRIEVASRTEIVDAGPINQIIISEIPYKVLKKDICFEIDKIRASKAIDGILEVRDETDFDGIRIVVDLKKNAPKELILTYLMNKTSLKTSYSANMVAIVDGRPKTLSLMDFIDAYLAHQVSVITRRSQFDLKKYSDRLHIVEGLIMASLNINEVVEIIKASNDKADSKKNLIARYELSDAQAEAIVTMPLYKLSHTDELVLEKEKAQLEEDITELNAILSDPNKLNRVIIKDLKMIADKYGDARKTSIEEKGEEGPVDKTLLISKDRVAYLVTRDGYFKRSPLKSYNQSIAKIPYPDIKQGDAIVSMGTAWTTDTLLCFTDMGNYLFIPVYKLEENKWKDKGVHINSLITMSGIEKIIKVIVASKLRDDLYIMLLTRNGYIKRMAMSELLGASKFKPTRAIKLDEKDALVDVKMTTGDSNIIMFTDTGNYLMYNENEIAPKKCGASGTLFISKKALLGNQKLVGLVSVQQGKNAKLVLVTNKGYLRYFSTNSAEVRNRGVRAFEFAYSNFKSDVHKLVYVNTLDVVDGKSILSLYDNDFTQIDIVLDDFYLTSEKNAKKNIKEITTKQRIAFIYSSVKDVADETVISQPIVLKEKKAPTSLNEEIDLFSNDETRDEIEDINNEEEISNNEEIIEESNDELEDNSSEESFDEPIEASEGVSYDNLQEEVATESNNEIVEDEPQEIKEEPQEEEHEEEIIKNKKDDDDDGNKGGGGVEQISLFDDF